MDANTAQVAIAGITMITSVTTAAFAFYTNRRTKRIEQTQKNIVQALYRRTEADDIRVALTPRKPPHERNT